LDLLTLIYLHSSGLQVIQHYRYSPQFQFTVAHALGLSVFTSRILATDLSQSRCHFNSHITSSWHSLILFLQFSAAASSEDLTQFSSDYRSVFLLLLNSQFQFSNLISLAEQSRAEQRSSLLPATSRHSHSWHRAPLGPMRYICSMSRLLFFFFFRCSSFDKKEGVGLFYNWCSLTAPFSTRGRIKVGDIYILYIIHKTQTDSKFYYIQGHLSMQDSAAACASTCLHLRNGS
jgi:hypothetical protein